jgi:hypothetical protein
VVSNIGESVTSIRAKFSLGLLQYSPAAINKSTVHPKITKISNIAFGPNRASSHLLKISLTTSTTPIAAKY